MTKKAQSLTELATFGSVLLLAVSFLISYGMRYNYQQEARMASFRMAMADAFNSDQPDASATIFLIEDKHVPNPQDTFGLGNFSSKQGVGEVTWGDNLGGAYGNNPELPKLKFVINGTSHEYTTQGFMSITSPARIFRLIPPGIYQELSWSNLRVYASLDDFGEIIYKAMLLVENIPDYDDDNETEVIDAVFLLQPGENIPMSIPFQIAGLQPHTKGDPVTELILLSSETAELNPQYMGIGRTTGKYERKNGDLVPEYVTVDTVQGLLPSDQTDKRHGTLKLEESTSQWKSTSTYDLNGSEVTHKIRGNDSDVPDPYPSSLLGGKTIIWPVTK